MASAGLSTGEARVAPPTMESTEQFIRVIVADSQAIFRAGLRKIFAVEDDIRVVGQAETLSQAVSAAKKFSASGAKSHSTIAPARSQAISVGPGKK